MSKTKAQSAKPAEGYLFLCTSKTEQEALSGFFGLAGEKWPVIRNIKPGTHLFLLNIHTRELHGCFEAAARPGFNMNPQAFGGSQKGSPFPCQVKVRKWLDAPPLQESEYSDLLTGRPLAGDATQRYYDLKVPKVRPLEERFMARSESENRRLERSEMAANTGVPSSWHEPAPVWYPDDHRQAMADAYADWLEPGASKSPAAGYHPAGSHPEGLMPGQQPLDWRDCEDMDYRDGAAPYASPHPHWQPGPSSFLIDDLPDTQDLYPPFSSEPMDWHPDEYARSASFANDAAPMDAVHPSLGMPLGPSEQAFSRHYISQTDRPLSACGGARCVEVPWDDRPRHNAMRAVEANNNRAPYHTAQLRMPPAFWQELEETGRVESGDFGQHASAGVSNAQQSSQVRGGRSSVSAQHNGSIHSRHSDRSATTLHLLGINDCESAKNVLRAVEASLGPDAVGITIDFMLVRRAHVGQEALINFQRSSSRTPSAASLLVQRMHGIPLEACLQPTRKHRPALAQKGLVADFCKTQGLEALAERFGTHAVCCWGKADAHNVHCQRPTFYGLPKENKLSPALQKVRDRCLRTSAVPSTSSRRHGADGSVRSTENGTAGGTRPDSNSSANGASKPTGQQVSQAKPASVSVKRKLEADSRSDQATPAPKAARKSNAQLGPAAGKQLPDQQPSTNGLAQNGKSDGAQQTLLQAVSAGKDSAADAADANSKGSGEKRRGGQRIEFQMPAAKPEARPKPAAGGVLEMTLEQSIAHRKGQAGPQPAALKTAANPACSNLEPISERGSERGARGRPSASSALPSPKNEAGRVPQSSRAVTPALAGSKSVPEVQMADFGPVSKHGTGSEPRSTAKVLIVDRRSGTVQQPRSSAAKESAQIAGVKRPHSKPGAAQQSAADVAPPKAKAKPNAAAAVPAPDRAPTPATPLLDDVAANQDRASSHASPARGTQAAQSKPDSGIPGHVQAVHAPASQMSPGISNQHALAVTSGGTSAVSHSEKPGHSRSHPTDGGAGLRESEGQLLSGKPAPASRAQADAEAEGILRGPGVPIGTPVPRRTNPTSPIPVARKSRPGARDARFQRKQHTPTAPAPAGHKPAAAIKPPASTASRTLARDRGPSQAVKTPANASGSRRAPDSGPSTAALQQKVSGKPTASGTCQAPTDPGTTGLQQKVSGKPNASGSRRAPIDSGPGTAAVQQKLPGKPSADALAAALAELEAQEAKVRALKAEAELKALRARVRALEAQQQAQPAAPAAVPASSNPPAPSPSHRTQARALSGSDQPHAVFQAEAEGTAPRGQANGVPFAEDPSIPHGFKGHAKGSGHEDQGPVAGPALIPAVRAGVQPASCMVGSDPATQAECFLSSLLSTVQDQPEPVSGPISLQHTLIPDQPGSNASANAVPEVMVMPSAVHSQSPITIVQRPVGQVGGSGSSRTASGEAMPTPAHTEAVTVAPRDSKPGADGASEVDCVSSSMTLELSAPCSSDATPSPETPAALAHGVIAPGNLQGNIPPYNASPANNFAPVAEGFPMQPVPGEPLSATGPQDDTYSAQLVAASVDGIAASSSLPQPAQRQVADQQAGFEQQPVTAMDVDDASQQGGEQGMEQATSAVLPVAAGPGGAEWVIDASDFDGDEGISLLEEVTAPDPTLARADSMDSADDLDIGS